jgi:predicted transcriptional regulator
VPAQPKQVTDAELAILKLLWEAESLTSKDIRQQLYPHGTSSDHGTVQKLLERLETKRLISRDRSAFVHVFRAKVSRAAVVGQQLESLADKLTDGSLTPFIMHAVSSKKLSPQEREAIQQLLNRRK